jgi:hypothetical protein
MRSHNSGIWMIVFAVWGAGCTVFDGSTKFTGDTTEYTSDTMHSITVSTSGETLPNGERLTDEVRVKIFVHKSFENLQQDVARGNGEYLASLAHLAKVPQVRQQAFFEHAMQQYAATIKSGNMTPERLRLAVLSNWTVD